MAFLFVERKQGWVDTSSEMPVCVAQRRADSWAWQCLLAAGRSWPVPSSPHSPATTPSLNNGNREACLFSFERTAWIFTPAFQIEHWHCLFELSSLFYWVLHPSRSFKILLMSKLHIPYRPSCSTSNSGTLRSCIWGPWLQTWQFDIDQAGCVFGICQSLCPCIVWLSVPFLCISKDLCVHPAFCSPARFFHRPGIWCKACLKRRGVDSSSCFPFIADFYFFFK